MPESTLVSLAVFHLGIFGARIILDSTVEIAGAEITKVITDTVERKK